MKYKGLNLFEWFIADDEDRINALSLVDSGAIKKDWVALREDKEVVRFATVDEDQHLLVALLLLPDTPIYRKFGDEEFYVYFSEDTVKEISELYLKEGNQGVSTIMHSKLLSGVTLVQSWITESETIDKIALYGMEAPVGSWAGILRVDNIDLWDDYIKTRILNGISVEGSMSTRTGSLTVEEANDVDLSDAETVKELQKLLGV